MKKILLMATAFIAITANAMNVKPIVQGPLCHGDATGTISVLVDGGNAPYTYLWNTGATTNAISNLTAGSYTVTATDNGGVTAASTIIINEADALALTSMVINCSYNGANDGSINLTVRGGTPDFTYAWNNGATTKDIGNLTAGSYTVNVTDGYGCQASLTSTVQEPLSPLIIGNYGGHGDNRSKETNGFGEGADNNLSVYPNPANGSLNLKTQQAGESEYSVINANGEVVKKQTFNTSETKADISALPAGNYLVQVKTANGTSWKNIVITK